MADEATSATGTAGAPSRRAGSNDDGMPAKAHGQLISHLGETTGEVITGPALNGHLPPGDPRDPAGAIKLGLNQPLRTGLRRTGREQHRPDGHGRDGNGHPASGPTAAAYRHTGTHPAGMITTPVGPTFMQNDDQSGARSGDHTQTPLPIGEKGQQGVVEVTSRRSSAAMTAARTIESMKQHPAPIPLRYDATGLKGRRLRLLSDLPTSDAGIPQDILIGQSEVICLDDTPSVLHNLRVQRLDCDAVAIVCVDQLAVPPAAGRAARTVLSVLALCGGYIAWLVIGIAAIEMLPVSWWGAAGIVVTVAGVAGCWMAAAKSAGARRTALRWAPVGPTIAAIYLFAVLIFA